MRVFPAEDSQQNLPRDHVEHVLEVYEDGGPRGDGVPSRRLLRMLFRPADELVDAELHRMDDEIHASLDPDSELVREQVHHEGVALHRDDVGSQKAAHRAWDRDRPQPGVVGGILEEAEEV